MYVEKHLYNHTYYKTSDLVLCRSDTSDKTKPSSSTSKSQTKLIKIKASKMYYTKLNLKVSEVIHLRHLTNILL